MLRRYKDILVPERPPKNVSIYVVHTYVDLKLDVDGPNFEAVQQPASEKQTKISFSNPHTPHHITKENISTQWHVFTFKQCLCINLY